MLQNNPVRNLQYDSDIRIAQQPRIDPPVFDNNTIITSVQRRSSLDNLRIPLPISTVQFSNNRSGFLNRTFVPLSGLDILHDMPSLHIEQTFELNEAFTAIESENRFTIRSPLGEALFAGTENSPNNQKLFSASTRSFQMRLLDKTHQEALSLRKTFSFGIICCQRRKIEVWIPPGELLGIIVETPSPFSTEFTIQNDKQEILYQIEGPNRCNCCMPKEAHFQVFSADMQILKGSIVRMWSCNTSQYTTNVYFNDTNLSLRSKALFLGAAFLLEYVYYQ